MSKHPAGVVAPFSMLVPITGMTAAWLILGETVTRAEALGGILVVGGVLLGSLRKRAKPMQEQTVPQATIESDRAAVG